MKKIITLLALAFCINGKAQIITTICGNGIQGHTGDGGQASSAELNNPMDIVFDAVGNLYIADNNCIRKVNTNGVISTIAGNGTAGYTGDGGQATASELNDPRGIAFNGAGNLYISDAGNLRIRVVNTLGIISTIAGNGVQGYSGDGGQATAAKLNYTQGITFDAANNLYIAEYGNYCVRKVNTMGVITTIAGNGQWGYAGDGGQATAAYLNTPFDVKFDALNNLYITDYNNNVIRKVNTLGIISTVAGNGYNANTFTGGYSGDGGQATDAELYTPSGAVVDTVGNLYIADTGNNRIRMVNSLGIISTLVGDSAQGYAGDGGLANAAALYWPYRATFDALGSLYIADNKNNRIRKMVYPCSTTVSYTLTQLFLHTWNAYPVYSADVISARWYWGDGKDTIGLYPSHTYSVAGKYNICVTAYSFCGDSVSYCQNDSVYRYSNNNTLSNMVYVNVLNGNQTTDINKLSKNNNQVNIYPNPTQNNFTIETSTTDKQTLQIFDVNGKLVLSQTINGKTNIDASHFAEGVYNLSLTGQSDVVNKRLVIVR
ncbi:MAG TPA: T9SS type A sorting domain-containing protein [Bacteroidia bacterium]|nr:T9SS type A sorting domain-containing protein [Bacteroidia bacterium]